MTSFKCAFKPRLVLHFDINKTIIISDAVSGICTRDMINSLLSECVWGVVTFPSLDLPRISDSLPEWSMIDAEPSYFPPKIASPLMPPSVVATYGEYLEVYRKVGRADRKKLKCSFTDPGCIGQKYRSYVDNLDSSLRHHVSLGSQGSQHQDLTQLDSLGCLISSGYYHILPSFFKAVRCFHNEERDFKIIFRTFGVDASNIAIEFNAFCENKHPLFPLHQSMDGMGSSGIDRRLHLPSCSKKLLRRGSSGDDAYIASVGPDKLVQIVCGISRIYSQMLSDLAHTEVIQDDFEWWNANDESDGSGKLLPIDLDDDNVIQIFFDDNVERDRAHIVDVRNAKTFEPISFETSNGLYIHRVEPINAILNENYFIEAIDGILQRHYHLNDESIIR